MIGVAVLVVAGVAWYAWHSPSALPQAQNGMTTLPLTQDVLPVTLSASEQQALNKTGLPSVAAGVDSATAAFQTVHTSDRLSDIQADLNATNLTGINAESVQITKDVAF